MPVEQVARRAIMDYLTCEGPALKQLALPLIRSTAARTGGQVLAYEVVACIATRDFKQRKQDMRELIEVTRGKVFTLQTLSHLVEHRRLKTFETREVPKNP